MHWCTLSFRFLNSAIHHYWRICWIFTHTQKKNPKEKVVLLVFRNLLKERAIKYVSGANLFVGVVFSLFPVRLCCVLSRCHTGTLLAQLQWCLIGNFSCQVSLLAALNSRVFLFFFYNFFINFLSLIRNWNSFLFHCFESSSFCIAIYRCTIYRYTPNKHHSDLILNVLSKLLLLTSVFLSVVENAGVFFKDNGTHFWCPSR